MATKQKKFSDPELAALTAIENALAADLNTASESPVVPDSTDKEIAGDALPIEITRRLEEIQQGAALNMAASDTSPLAEPSIQPQPLAEPSILPQVPFLAPEPQAPFVATAAAATNEERRNTDLFLQTLHRRPSRGAYGWATFFSLLWLGGCAAFAWSQNMLSVEALTANLLPVQVLFGISAVVLPVLAFFVAAMLAVRAQEIRLASRAIGEAAIHLAQPESLTTDAVLTVSHTIRREVAAIGDGVERAIARAGELEALVRNEISTLERAYFDNEVRIHSLIEELNAQREAITSNVDRVRATMSGTHEVMVTDLEEIAERLTVTMNGASQRVTSLLAERGEEIRHGITEAGNNVTSSLEAKINDIATVFERTGAALTLHLHESASNVTHSMAQTSRDMVETLAMQGANVKEAFASTASTMENAVSALETNFVQRGDEVSSKLKETSDIIASNISGSVHQIHAAAAESSAFISSEILKNTGHLNEQLLATSHEIVNNIMVRGGDVREHIAIAGTQIAEEISLRGKEIHDRLDGAVNLANDAIGTRVEMLADRLDNASQRINYSVQTQGQQLESNLTGLAEHVTTVVGTQIGALKGALDSQSHELAETLEKTANETQIKIATTGHEISAAMAHQGERINENLRSNAETLALVIEQRGKEVHDVFSARLGDFDAAIGASVTAVGTISNEVNSLTTTISDRLGDMDNLITVKGRELADSLVTRTDELTGMLSNAISSQLTEVESVFTEQKSAFVASLHRQSQEVSATIGAELARFDTGAEQHTTKITANFDMLVSRINNALDTRAQSINETLINRTSEMAKTMVESGREVAETLSSATEGLNGVLGERALEIANTLESRVADIETRIVERLDNVSTSLEEKGKSTSVLLGTRIAELADLFDNRGTRLAEDMGNRLGQMTMLIDNGGARLMENLNASIADIDGLFNTSSSSLIASLGNGISEISTIFEQSSGTIVNKLNNRFVEIDQQMEQRTNLLASSFSERLSGMHDMLDAKGQDLSQKIASTGAALEETITNTTHATLTSLHEVKGSINAEVTGVLQHIGETSQLLERVSAVASEKLVSASDTLSGRVQNLENVMGVVAERTERTSEQLGEKINTLNHVSAQSLDRAEKLGETLEIRSMALTQAAQNQAQALATTTAALDEVGVRLGDVLGERHVQLSNLVDAIRARTGDIDTMTEHLTQTVGTAINQMHQQYAHLHNASDTQGARIAGDMVSAYEAAIGEMNQTFGAAATRFRDNMDDLRTMSGHIRQELDDTRAELRRGVMELPEETQQTAANMRRIVSDQIKALNELSSLVTRSNRSLDIETASQAPAPQQRATREQEYSSPAPMHFSAPQQSLQPPVAQPAPAPARPAPVSTATASAPPAKGWLSDLLNRASTEEPAPRAMPQNRERSRRNSLESLDSISLDIARMIDHAAAVELWDRYKRGERNVFTRRLYTLQGQQTFEDIRSKYAVETEFRQVVDRYIGEFERLLSEVATDDRDGILTNTYLTSETGKVYTMLAHAAGRLK